MSDDPTISITPDENVGYRLRAEMTINLPRAQVFNFFADAMQLERITPPLLKFTVLTPQPIKMQAGLFLDYRLRIRRIPVFWKTEIAVWEPPLRFVDLQLRGPYKQWHHEHTFEEVDGQTIVRDDVHYIPRGGKLIHNLLVKPDLEKIFRFRQDKLTEIFAEVIARQSAVSHPQSSSQLGLPVAAQEYRSESLREFNP